MKFTITETKELGESINLDSLNAKFISEGWNINEDGSYEKDGKVIKVVDTKNNSYEEDNRVILKSKDDIDKFNESFKKLSEKQIKDLRKRVVAHTNLKIKNWYVNAKADYGVVGKGTAKIDIKNNLFIVDYVENGKKLQWEMAYYDEYAYDNKPDYFYNVWMEQAVSETLTEYNDDIVDKKEVKRYINSFEEINNFFDHNKKEPTKNKGKISEYKLGARLDAMRKQTPFNKDILKPFDKNNLLSESSNDGSIKVRFNSKVSVYFSDGVEVYTSPKDGSFEYNGIRFKTDFTLGEEGLYNTIEDLNNSFEDRTFSLVKDVRATSIFEGVRKGDLAKVEIGTEITSKHNVFKVTSIEDKKSTPHFKGELYDLKGKLRSKTAMLFFSNFDNPHYYDKISIKESANDSLNVFDKKDSKTFKINENYSDKYNHFINNILRIYDNIVLDGKSFIITMNHYQKGLIEYKVSDKEEIKLTKAIYTILKKGGSVYMYRVVADDILKEIKILPKGRSKGAITKVTNKWLDDNGANNVIVSNDELGLKIKELNTDFEKIIKDGYIFHAIVSGLGMDFKFGKGGENQRKTDVVINKSYVSNNDNSSDNLYLVFGNGSSSRYMKISEFVNLFKKGEIARKESELNENEDEKIEEGRGDAFIAKHPNAANMIAQWVGLSKVSQLKGHEDALMILPEIDVELGKITSGESKDNSHIYKIVANKFLNGKIFDEDKKIFDRSITSMKKHGHILM